MKPDHTLHGNRLDHAVKEQADTDEKCDKDGISPPKASQLSSSGSAVTGQPQDIICGRGLHIMSHLGNIKLHRIVNRHRHTYQTASRREKAAIAQSIVDEIKRTGSRFIRRAEDGRDDEWIEVDKETAYRKVGHALRLRKTHPQQASLQARSGQELSRNHDSTADSSNGTMSTALHQGIGMIAAVPQNAQNTMMHHPSRLSSLIVPDPWQPPLLGNQLHPVGPQFGLRRPQPQVSSSAVDGYGQILMNAVFATAFQSALSSLAQPTNQPESPLQGYMRNVQEGRNATVESCQESPKGR
ncbi:MAG: hypothetical protein SGBAC_011884 [Bacillariaceae sp.]